MTNPIKSSWTLIDLLALNFRSCALLLDCAVCGSVTQVHIEREEDGTLSYGSYNTDDHFSVAKKSPYRPSLEVTPEGKLLILCGQCISTDKELRLRAHNFVAGMFSINGKYSRCTSRSHEGWVCGLPSGHEQKFDHCFSRAGNPIATWKGDFDGGYYQSIKSATPGVDKTR